MSAEQVVASRSPHGMTTRRIRLRSYGRVQLGDLAAPIK